MNHLDEDQLIRLTNNKPVPIFINKALRDSEIYWNAESQLLTINNLTICNLHKEARFVFGNTSLDPVSYLLLRDTFEKITNTTEASPLNITGDALPYPLLREMAEGIESNSTETARFQARQKDVLLKGFKSPLKS